MKLKRLNRESVIITVGFFLLSFLWIKFSDKALHYFIQDAEQLTRFQTYKGSFYITLAALYIFYLSNRYLNKKNNLIYLLNKKNEWQQHLISNLPNVDAIVFDNDPRILFYLGNHLLIDIEDLDEKGLDKILTFRNDRQLINYLAIKKDILAGKPVNLEFDDESRHLKIIGKPLYNDEEEIIAGLVIFLNNKDKIQLLKDLQDEKEKYDMLFKEYHGVNLELTNRNQELISKNKALQASQERYQNYFMQSRDGIFRIDFDTPLDLNTSIEVQKRNIIEKGFVAECNPSFAAIYGKKNPEELLRQKMSELHNIETVSIYFDLLENMVINGYHINNVETREVISGDMEQYYLNTLIGIIENKELIRIWGTKTNITQLKVFERELIEAKKAAEESDRLKSAFLANMSHEIRTPLNGIIGFAELLAKNDLNQKQKDKYIKIVKSSNNQLLRIIDDILDISKIDTGQITIQKTAFHLNQLMDDIDAYLNQEILRMDKNLIIECKKHFKDKQDIIFSDRDRVFQIISNLANNAVKFTEEGKITFGYHLNSPSELEFFVCDTGIGISDEIHDAIFNQFQQGEEYMTKTYGGTGLGLAICKGILDLMDGDIKVKSEIGKGSTFSFTIPYFRNNGDF